MRPNPSFESRPNGRPPGPGRWYAVHFHRPGLGALPSVPPQLKRWATQQSPMQRPSMLPSCFVAGRAEESPSVLSHRAQLSQLWRHVSVGSNASIRPCQKHCPTHWKAAFLRAATAYSAAARNASLCSSAQVLRAVGALRRRAAPRSQLVRPPKGGNCTALATLGKGSRRVQPSLRVPPAWPNPSFNQSANSRLLGPHSAVVYRRTARPKHPAVVARLTQTLGIRHNPCCAPQFSKTKMPSRTF